MIRRSCSRVDVEPATSTPHLDGTEEDDVFSELLYTKNQIMPPYNFSLSKTTSEEFLTQIEKAVVFPNMKNFTLEELVEDMLFALEEKAKKSKYFEEFQRFGGIDTNKSAKGPGDKDGSSSSSLSSSEETEDESMSGEIELQSDTVMDDEEEELKDTRKEFTVDLAMKSIFVSETVSNLSQCIQRTKFRDFDGITYDDSWIVMMCELQSIKDRKIVIARMAYDMYVMPSCQKARCIILVLANSAEKGMKSALQTGTNFGTILSLPKFIPEIVKSHTPEEIIQRFKKGVRSMMLGESQIMESMALKEAVQEKEKFALGKPFSGIIREVKKRLPYYYSDFSDGLTGYKTKPKLFAAVVFQYFATILPIIALGQAVDLMTDQNLSTKTVVYSQFFGSILYAIFSGNPMMIFQVSSTILLYSKGLFQFAQLTNRDFRLLFGLTGVFSGLFLTFIGIFNISNLMVYCTSSVADMTDVFQSITFVQGVILSVIQDHSDDYLCDEAEPGCSPAEFILNILTIILTMVFSSLTRSIHNTGMFNIAFREFISDMWIVFGVIGSSCIASLAFGAIPLDPFSYIQDATPFYILEINEVDFITIAICFILAIPLSILIFLDHNLNGEFIADPRNKLHKGRALHTDMFMIGIINAVFGVFGLCSMQGIFPNTPLHIKQMADVEENQDQGVTVKTLIRVRDTRLTQLFVGVLVGASTFLLPLPISYIPKAALNGLLLYIGYISLDGNGLVERLRLFLEDQSTFPPNHPIRKVPPIESHKLSLLQIIQLTIISFISFSQYSNYLTFLFPVVLALFIPVRLFLIPQIIKKNYLDILDPTKV